jgi:hypothetical protein
MKNIIILLSCLLASCSFKKVTEVNIKNENDFPISLTIKANNSLQTFTSIKAHSEYNGIFDWTNIEKKDGQWIFFVKNENTGGIDSFSHGYFIKGELNSFADLICKGSELKVNISE